MKAIFVTFIVCFASSVYATNYYFSALSGNDSRTISEAQDPSTPWKTLDRLNSFFGSLKPGDSVLLKRDETFYGSIIVKRSGSIIFPIVVGAYGVGEKPVISSFITLNGWVSKGKSIWESVDSTSGSAVNMLLLNGIVQEMGRYPNSNAANNGYLNFESHAGKISITDNELDTPVNWKGAQLVIRSRHWILDRSLITAQVGHTIFYSTASPYEPYENYGYFIQNSIKTLDKTGEWYFNPVTQKLYVYFGSKGPSSFTVQAATTMNDLVSSSSFSNIIFDNLAMKGSNSSGVFIHNGSNIHVQNCDISFSGISGFIVHGHKNLHIENCTISNSNNNAIDLEYGIANAVIRNNIITNTAVIPGMMKNGEGAGLAIYSNGDGNIIEGNEIHKTGYIGITFYGNNVMLKNNFIDSFCFVKDDGGGIYSHGEATPVANRKIIGNIIMNGIGAGKGTDIADKRSVTGIYMDANITDVEIRDNTVTTCNQGILIQSSAGMIIKNNTIYNNNRQLTMIRDKDNNPVRNSLVTHNIFFSKTQDQWALYAMSSADDLKLFGRFDSNFYARPLDDRLTIYNSYIGANGTVTQNLNLDGWKETYGHDEHSKKSAKQVLPFKVNKLTGSNKFANGGDFTEDVEGLAGNSCVVSWSNAGMLDGGYIEVAPSSRVSSLYAKVGSVTAGKQYVLRYSLRGAVESEMSIGASLKQTGAPFAVLAPIQSRKIDLLRTEKQIVFTPSVSEASAYLVFKTDDQKKYYIDNLQFYEANVQVTDPDDSIRFEYNATNVATPVALNGNYVDAAGRLYMNNITLQPYSSAVLIKTGDNVKNTPPIVNILTPSSDTVFSALSNVSINVEAKDVDGFIEKVEFYNDSTLLRSEETPEFGCTLDSLLPGKYTITARAIDNNGLATNSSPVAFTVAAKNIAPAVTITTPKNNSVFTPFSSVVIKAEATDVDGSISKVEFYNDSTLLKTEQKSPYDCTLDSLVPGKYTITAKAIDNNGLATTSSPVVFSVSGDIAPTVTIITPDNNATYLSGGSVYFTATASDADGSVSKVAFYNDTALLYIATDTPYTFKWEHVRSGNYTITAKATDNSGLVTISAPVNIFVVPNTPPTVNIVTPLNDQTFAEGVVINVKALAADSDGRVTRVEFYNETNLIAVKYKEPFSFSWKDVLPGSYTLTARALDNWGAVTISSPVIISVLDSQQSIPAKQAARGSSQVSPVSTEVANTPVDDLLSQLNVYKLSDFKVWPNPAITTLKLNFDRLQIYQKAYLTIHNLSGAILKKYPVTVSGNKIEVDVSFLSSGMYIIGLSGDNFSINKKFFKTN